MKKEEISALLTLPVLFSACLEDDVPVEPRVYFVAPTMDEEVPSELVIRFGVSGFVVRPAGVVEEGSGYLNLFVDRPCAAFGSVILPAPDVVTLTGGEQEIVLTLPLGRHFLCVQASDGLGFALPIAQAIEVEVIEVGVALLSPSEGDARMSPVQVDMQAYGLVVEPRGTARASAGHFVLAIDRDCVPEGESVVARPGVLNLDNGERTVRLELPTGTHQLCLGFADGDDVALAHRAYVSFWVY